MLIINPNERIGCNEYFNHSFFKEKYEQKDKVIKFPDFNITCK